MSTDLTEDRTKSRPLPLIHFLVDSAIWALAFPFSMWLRFDYDFSQVGLAIAFAIVGAVGLQGEFGLFIGQYRRRWRYGSFDEMRGVALAAAGTGAVLTCFLWWERSIPRSVPVLAAGFSLLGHVTVRSIWRLWVEKRNIRNDGATVRLVVVGAGDAGAQVIRNLRETQNSGYLPVALVDDDPNKRNLQIAGVSVGGDIDALSDVARRYEASAVLIAAPSADGEFVRRVTRISEAADLEVFVLPALAQLFGAVNAGDIRPVDHADLLGRSPAEIDTGLVAGYITGRRVLVTGAGGSIGSEICRQLAKFEPAELLMLDRDESGLHGTQLSIRGRALLEDPSLILGDIRDAQRIDEIFETYRPEVVFHTAALKHLPLLEMHPDEGWKTNVLGTRNLLESAGRHGVDRFVNVSTDKAANPTSVLGWTKRITERLTAQANHESPTQFVSVRFGNVLGSNGSVLKAFEAQSANGGPITVTHPDITRFFMTIEEASRLTIHAGAIGEPGEIMILDMGEPVKIIDVAKRFANRHTPPLEIVFTGLRKNEKMHEDLVSHSEEGERRRHPLITHVEVAPLTLDLDVIAGPAPDFDVMVGIASSATSSAGAS